MYICNGTKIYQFKIYLMDIKPKIWRQIQVPAMYSFEEFHQVIQDVMGWDNEHLHQFIVPPPGKKMTPRNMHNNEFLRIDQDMERYLGNVFKEEKQEAIYWYDFGDDWVHHLKLEKILDMQEDTTYPICLGGKRACPPEDCGGVPGYYRMLEGYVTLDDEFPDAELIPDDFDEDEEVEYEDDYLEEFDPEAFDPKEVRFAYQYKLTKPKNRSERRQKQLNRF